MGYKINNETLKSNVFLSKEDAGKAFDVLKQEALSQNELSHWITLKEVELSKNFDELMTAMRWMPQFSNNGDVTSLEHNGFNVAEEALVFKTISPFVKEGSYIEYERQGYSADLKVRFDFTKNGLKETVWSKEYNENKSRDEWVLNSSDDL